MSDLPPRIESRLGHFFAGVLFAAMAVCTPASGQVQAQDPWLVVESEGTSKPFIAKILNREPTAAERGTHKRLLRVTWSYAPAPNGLPRESDLRLIALLEDGLSDALEEGLKSKLVMSETGDGGRLWLF